MSMMIMKLNKKKNRTQTLHLILWNIVCCEWGENALHHINNKSNDNEINKNKNEYDRSAKMHRWRERKKKDNF